MIKIKHIKRAYLEEITCDLCGAIMRHNGMVLTSYPPKYPYECSNPDCDGHITLFEDELPRIKYEFEEEEEKENV